MGWVINDTPRPVWPWERPSTRCIWGWVGPGAGLHANGKTHPHRNSIPGPPRP